MKKQAQEFKIDVLTLFNKQTQKPWVFFPQYYQTIVLAFNLYLLQ